MRDDGGTTMPRAATVAARPRWNRTGLRVEQGSSYRLAADGVWSDRQIRCGPEGYRSPSWLFRLVERCRRHPSALWFALIGTVEGDRATRFVIGSGTDWTASATGELHCYANDLSFMRFNNSGAVTLTLSPAGEPGRPT